MLWQKISQWLRWLGEQIETVLALLLGAICSILGFFGIAPSVILSSAILGILTLLAFALIRDRSQRKSLQRDIKIALEGPGLDTIFSKSADDIPISENAEQEIWFAQETGTYSLETKKTFIKSLLRKGGIVRFVVINPKEEVLRRLALRNSDFSLDAIIARTRLFQHYINSLITELDESAEQLQVRFTPYIIDTACFFVDPNSPVEKKRKAAILYLSFRIPFEERMGIVLQGDTSPKLFSHYYQHIHHLFQYASKIVLIAGLPQSGKTTMIMKMIAGISTKEQTHLFSVFSKAVWKGSRCIGYEVVTSISPVARNFATRKSNGSYEFDNTVWTSVANELEQAYLASKIIIIDEIGPQQSLNADFSLVIEKIINDPSTTMFATILLDDNCDLIKKAKYHYRSTVLRLPANVKERYELEKTLSQEIQSTIHLTDL